MISEWDNICTVISYKVQSNATDSHWRSCIVLLVIATGVAVGKPKEVFAVNEAPVFTPEEARKLLSGGGLSADSVARTLARITDRSESIGGFTFEKLFNLNTYDPEIHCSKAALQWYDGVCKRLDSFASLSNYCSQCGWRIKQACKASARTVLENVVRVESLRDVKARVDSYIRESRARSDYPLRLFVVDLLHTLEPETRLKVMNFCAKLDEAMERELLFFGWTRNEFLKLLKSEERALEKAIHYCRLTSSSKL